MLRPNVRPGAVLEGLSDGDGRPALRDWLRRHPVQAGHIEPADLKELRRVEHWNVDDDAQQADVHESMNRDTTTIERRQRGVTSSSSSTVARTQALSGLLDAEALRSVTVLPQCASREARSRKAGHG